MFVVVGGDVGGSVGTIVVAGYIGINIKGISNTLVLLFHLSTSLNIIDVISKLLFLTIYLQYYHSVPTNTTKLY